MASAIGHMVGAAAAWEAARRVPGGRIPSGPAWYLLPTTMALAPDLDVAALILFGSGVSHRGPSHSLLVAFGLSVIGAIALRFRLSTWKAVTSLGLLFAIAAVHPLLDFLMGRGPPVPFLWPWQSAGWLSPVQLIPTAYYSDTFGGLFSVLFSMRTLKGVLLELFSLGPLWLAVRSRQREVTRVALLLSAAGFFLTWLLYR